MIPFYKIFKLLYPKFHWEVKTNEKIIYLTFDDGPIPDVTRWVLEQLKKYNAKATFFCIGDNVRKHPEVLELTKAAGHKIGNHTYNHLNGWETSKDKYLDNFKKAEKLSPSSLFRPPYGRIKMKQAQKIMETHQIIMWTVLTKDYSQEISPEECLKRAIKGSKKGAIVLFHDSLKAERNLKYALPKFLEYFSERGYRFESLHL